ncbi:MAG: diadenylate cyclase CdaA [bacterium]|nr:TIGR00159 family protein [Myxococcales bacterium]MCB9542627.1 TIGR00159 family protein [Myxococcales bacterium]
MSDLDLRSAMSSVLDVVIIFYIIYRVLLIIKGTRAVPMLVGITAIAVLYGLSQEGYLNLPTFNWLLEQFIGNILIILVVLFQADIRRALASFGRAQILTSFRTSEGAQVIDELVKATTSLADRRIGALVVIEREADLSPYLEESTRIEAKLSKELLYSLFVPERQNPLHDGAVVVRNGRIQAAGVFLPMSVNPAIDRALGTRHRAALGLSEETDAVIIVVSEERGAVSLAHEGELMPDLSPSELRDNLTTLMIKRPTRLFRRDRSERGERGVMPAVEPAAEDAASRSERAS